LRKESEVEAVGIEECRSLAIAQSDCAVLLERGQRAAQEGLEQQRSLARAWLAWKRI
jgi:hypothetical protein